MFIMIIIYLCLNILTKLKSIILIFFVFLATRTINLYENFRK